MRMSSLRVLRGSLLCFPSQDKIKESSDGCMIVMTEYMPGAGMTVHVMFLIKHRLVPGQSWRLRQNNFSKDSFLLRDTGTADPSLMIRWPPSPRTYLAIWFMFTR